MPLLGRLEVIVESSRWILRGAAAIEVHVSEVVLRPRMSRIGGSPKVVNGPGWVFVGAPAVVETPPDHVDGLEIAARGRAPKPFERAHRILRQSSALEKHAAIADLRIRQAFRGGDVYPVGGALRILRKQGLQSARSHMGEELDDR